jgi:hypothetical protein
MPSRPAGSRSWAYPSDERSPIRGSALVIHRRLPDLRDEFGYLLCFLRLDRLAKLLQVLLAKPFGSTLSPRLTDHWCFWIGFFSNWPIGFRKVVLQQSTEIAPTVLPGSFLASNDVPFNFLAQPCFCPGFPTCGEAISRTAFCSDPQTCKDDISYFRLIFAQVAILGDALVCIRYGAACHVVHWGVRSRHVLEQLYESSTHSVLTIVAASDGSEEFDNQSIHSGARHVGFKVARSATLALALYDFEIWHPRLPTGFI